MDAHMTTPRSVLALIENPVLRAQLAEEFRGVFPSAELCTPEAREDATHALETGEWNLIIVEPRGAFLSREELAAATGGNGYHAALVGAVPNLSSLTASDAAFLEQADGLLVSGEWHLLRGIIPGALRAANDRRERFQERLARARLERTAERLQEPALLGQIAEVLTHHFSNSLSVASACISLLRRRMPESGGDAELVARLGLAVEEAQSRLRWIQALHRVRSGVDEAFDIHELLAEFQRLVPQALGASLTVKITAQTDRIIARADREALRNALLRTVVGGARSMPDGGSIAIRLDELPPAGPVDDTGKASLDDAGRARIIVECSPRGAWREDVLVEVAEGTPDRVGVGEDPSSPSGFGSTAEGGADPLRVQVRCERTSGEPGARFVITFPLDGLRFRSPEDQAASTSVTVPWSANALMAEDQADIRALMAMVLRQVGFSVTEAADGEEALSLFRRRPEQYDLVIVDVDLPRLDGISCLDEIQRQAPRLPALIVSGRPLPAMIRQEREIRAVLDKPFDPATLARVARELVGRAPAQRTGT
jgi:CheY-like chemotaxis protein